MSRRRGRRRSLPGNVDDEILFDEVEDVKPNRNKLISSIKVEEGCGIAGVCVYCYRPVERFFIVTIDEKPLEGLGIHSVRKQTTITACDYAHALKQVSIRIQR